ncbi:MAG: ATP-binding protein [Desulfobacterales bacterium]|nr:ATP-binding protein [Desulfobacterales bacterium]
MFKASRRPNGLDISLSSTLENIDRADKNTKGFLHGMGLEAEAFAIRVAMREGILNAIRHGSCGDRNRIIRYSLRLENNSLIMEIEDEGSGFDWRTSLENKHLSNSGSGRGLSIMKAYFADVTFNDKGNKLILRKKIS